jgi:hypothetical protein
MTRFILLATRIALVPVVVGLVLTARASAQEDQFRRGLEMLEKKQWQSAASLMREAIQLRPMESTNKVRSGFGAVFGTGGTEYLPHFFLGQALFNAGDCSGAVSEWVTSEQQRAVESRSDLLKFLRNGYVECEKKGVLPPGRLEKELARIAGLIKEANTQAGVVATLGQANLDIWQKDANARDQFDRARTEIENARARYEAGRASRMQVHLEEAANAVARARTLIEAVDTRLHAAIDTQRSVQSLVREVGEAISVAEGLNAQIESKRVPFTTAMTGAHQQGRDAISRARERLAEGTKTLSPPTLSAARSSAIEAQNHLKGVLDEIGRTERDTQQRLFTEALTRTDETFTLMEAAVSALERFSTERPNVLPPDKVAERDAVLREVNQLRRRLQAARRDQNAANVTSAGQAASDLRDRLNILIGAFGPLTLRDRGVREQLETGARQYLGGEYQQAVATLAVSESLEPEVPLRLHFHLFKAASLYELFLRSRETDQALRSQALAEVEHCKAIDSTFQPDGRAFSPRFLAFYQSVTAPATPPAAAAAPAAVTPPGAQ